MTTHVVRHEEGDKHALEFTLANENGSFEPRKAVMWDPGEHLAKFGNDALVAAVRASLVAKEKGGTEFELDGLNIEVGYANGDGKLTALDIRVAGETPKTEPAKTQPAAKSRDF